jgi:hypothetical protein
VRNAATSGTGCNGNTLTAATLPWADATFRSHGTGLPTISFVVSTVGFTPIPNGTVPLASLLVEGAPGCDVLLDAILRLGYFTTNGTVESSLFLPNTPPLVGLTFYQQLVPFEFDAMGSLAAITATNALQVTVGDF